MQHKQSLHVQFTGTDKEGHLLHHVNFQEKLVMDLGVLGAGQSPVFFPKGKNLEGSKPFFEAKPSLANNLYHVHDIKFHLPILTSWCFIANSLKQEWRNLMPGTKQSTGQKPVRGTGEMSEILENKNLLVFRKIKIKVFLKPFAQRQKRQG